MKDWPRSALHREPTAKNNFRPLALARERGGRERDCAVTVMLAISDPGAISLSSLLQTGNRRVIFLIFLLMGKVGGDDGRRERYSVFSGGNNFL